MIATSETYKEYFENNNILGKLEVIASLSIEDVSFKENSDMFVNDEMYYSNYEDLMLGHRDNFDYGTLEKNFYTLDDSMEFPRPDSSKQAWETSYISKAGCFFKYDEIPCLYMKAHDQTKLYNSIGMTFTFDDVRGDYPTKLRIKTFEGETLKQDFVVENEQGVKFIMEHSLEDYNNVYVYFLRTKNPCRRLRLNEVVWGIVTTFTSKETIELKGEDTSDPLSRELPTRNLSLTVNNMDLSYNQDNPRGVNRFFQERQQLKLKFKDYYPDGTFEEIDYGTYLLDGKPETNKREATFNAEGYLEYNNNSNFYKQVHSDTPLSYKSIATDIFEDMVLPVDENQNKLYYIDDSLDELYCNVPLPLETHAQLLKLIAQACFCTLREYNNGIIRIEPLEFDMQDLYIDFSIQSEEPSGETSELIREVNVKKYSYTISEDASEIYSGEITVNGDTDLHLEYTTSAKDVTATLPEGVTIVSETYYVNACDLVVTSDSEIIGEIKLNGKQINKDGSSTTTRRTGYSNGTSGEIDNVLVSDTDVANTLAERWLEYAQNRNKYKLQLDKKYDMRLQSLDNIKFETQFSEELKGIVTGVNWTYNGGISGQVEIKSLGLYNNE